MGTQNISGRRMVKYDPTKSDPICKWRNASVDTVVELVNMLPKERMSKAEFREHMSHFYNGSFFRTPYQLALQLALYYEDNDEYIPRFTHCINEEEAFAYLHKWVKLYYVPNPFTKRGFINVVPSVNLLNGLADFLENHPSKTNLATAGAALFGGEMGNILCVKFILNEYSNIIRVDEDNNMRLLSTNYGQVDVHIRRDDKKAFFEHFK